MRGKRLLGRGSRSCSSPDDRRSGRQVCWIADRIHLPPRLRRKVQISVASVRSWSLPSTIAAVGNVAGHVDHAEAHGDRRIVETGFAPGLRQVALLELHLPRPCSRRRGWRWPRAVPRSSRPSPASRGPASGRGLPCCRRSAPRPAGFRRPCSRSPAMASAADALPTRRGPLDRANAASGLFGVAFG